MRRSPAERYILCRLMDGVGIGELHQELAARQLDVLPLERVSAYEAGLNLPVGLAPRDGTNYGSQRFLVRHGVRQFFHPDGDVRGARLLLERPLAREFVEVLVVAGADDNWIASASSRRGTPISARAIRLYRYFYFDLSVLDSGELFAFLGHKRGENVDSSTEDSRLRAARSRETSLGFLLEALRAGSMPSNLQLGRILRAAQTTAVAATLDAGLRGDARRSLLYSTIAKNVTEIIQLVGDPSGDLQHEIKTLMLGTSTETVPHVSELGGSHTTDLLGEPTDMLNV